MIILVFLIFLGLFFWCTNLKLLILARDWPMILIFFGVMNLFGFGNRNKKRKIITDLEKGRITPDEAEEKLRQVSK